MAAPTNVSALTATDLGTLPASITQTVDDAGTTYTVWYKTTPAADGVLSVFGYGDASVYKPDTRVFLGPASAPVAYLNVAAGDNQPVLFPVTGGVTYYIRFQKNAGNPTPAVLTIAAQDAPTGALAAGMIASNDDVDGMPLSIIDAAGPDATVITYIQGVVAGESVALLDDGTTALVDKFNNQVVIYDTSFAVVGTVPTGYASAVLTSDRTDTFYVTVKSGSNFVIQTFDATGTVSATSSTVGAYTDAPEAIAVNPAGTILYYFKNSGVSATIKRWDLPGDVALSNLVTTGALLRDMFVLSDTTIIVADLVNDLFKQYSAAGALTNSFAATSRSGDRITRGATEATVWLWNKISVGDGQETFTEYTLASGAVVGTPIDGYLYSAGGALASNLTPPLTDSQAFGNSESCPFWILQTAFDVCTAPSISDEPADVTVTVGTVVSLTVTAAGTAPLSYQWYLGESGDTTTPIVGATSATYTTDALTETTTFWVRVSNECSLVDADSVTVTVTVGMPSPGDVSTVEYRLRWLRQSPTVFSDGKRIWHRRFQVDFQPGVGPTDGDDPIVLVRTSDDGGFTWSSFREMTLGQRGEYAHQMRLFQLGAAYNRVYEISGDSPTRLCIVQAWLDIDGGDH